MKGKSDDLFQLIKSLTRSEKRFFRLSASIQEGEKNYTKIFDAIEKQSRKPSGKYDEDRLLEFFKNEKFVRHFSFEKNRLYHIILKTLNEYHTNGDEYSIVQEMIQSARILYDKALFTQCKKLLSKAKELAYSQELYRLILLILPLERALIRRNSISGDPKVINKLHDEVNDVLRKIRNINDYEGLASKMIAPILNTGNRGKIIAPNLLKHSLLSSPSRALTPYTKAVQYNILFTYGILTCNYHLAHINTKKGVELFEGNNNLKRSKNYPVILNNHLHSCSWYEKYDEMKVFIQKLRNLSINAPELKATVFMDSYIHETAMLTRTGNSKEGILLLSIIEKGIGEYKNGKNGILKLRYNIIRLLIGAGAFQKALLWYNGMLQNAEKPLRDDDLSSSAQLLSLIIHYELGNDSLLPYIIRSIYRTLKSKENISKIELAFIDFFRKKLHPGISQKELVAAFANLAGKIKAIAQDPFEYKIIIEYFDYVSWLESKIEDRTMEEILKEKAKKKNRLS